MKIVLVAHNLRSAGGLSVGKNIVSLLPEIAPQHEYLLVVPQGCGYDTFSESDNVTVWSVPRMAPLKRRLCFDRSKLPKLVRQFAPDWVWALGNMGLFNPPSRQSILFQDSHFLYPMKHFGYTPWEGLKAKPLLWAQRRAISSPLANTQHVYCQTDTARKRFAESFSYPLSQTGLCPNAVSELIVPESSPPVPAPLEPYPDRFRFFCLAKYYPYKNQEGIVSAYERHRDRLQNTLCVMAVDESQGPRAKKLVQRIRSAGLQDHILTVGQIDQTVIGSYYHHSHALLFPTLLESFSGTYLEAMQFGCPILTSDLDFAHDVCGDAAHYVDPLDPDSIAQGMMELMSNPSLCQSLIQRGDARKTSYFRSWPDILRQVLDTEGIEHE